MVAIAALVATWAMLGTALAQRQAVPKPQDKLALGENEVKQLLLLMDTNENGKISKQEWMKFMEAEFDRLDKDKKGQLDAKEWQRGALWHWRFHPYCCRYIKHGHGIKQLNGRQLHLARWHGFAG
jgi:hypothetical protein